MLFMYFSSFSEQVKVVQKKLPWTEIEKKAIDRHFMGNIRRGNPVRKHEAELCLEKEPCLARRSWKTIKFHVKNRHLSYKRKFSVEKGK